MVHFKDDKNTNITLGKADKSTHTIIFFMRHTSKMTIFKAVNHTSMTVLKQTGPQ